MIEPKILSAGYYVPLRRVTNYDLEQKVDTNSRWIYDNLGIKERRVAMDETTCDLAERAAIRAIDNSSLRPEEIDAVIVATSTSDTLAPSTAAIVQGRLDLHNAAAFDINAVCSSGVYLLSTAFGLIRGGIYRKILIIGVDTFSKVTDWSRRDCVFFGDGAGALIISGQSEKHFLSSDLNSDGKGWENFKIKNTLADDKVVWDNNYFEMNGSEVYKTAIKVLPHTIKYGLMKAEIEKDDVCHVLPHQPSVNILKKASELSGIPWSKWHTNMEKYANTSSASILLLFAEKWEQGTFQDQEILLFLGVGSGWTYGSVIYRW